LVEVAFLIQESSRLIITCNFVQGEDRVQQILAAYEATGGAKTPSEMAKALLKVEALLTAAAAMDEAWPEHWRTNWQRAASYCVDWKHALLLTATLQVSQSSFP